MSFITSAFCLKKCMDASSSVYRTQLFLIRSFGGHFCRAYMEGKGRTTSSSVLNLGNDTDSVIRKITPKLDSSLYKGQAGKVAVIGGCREYTGAPYFAAISALKIGADLSHIFCTKDAAAVIKSYSPELIVHPILEESYSVRDDKKEAAFVEVLNEVMKWLKRFDCIVVGPGLGRDPFLLDCVSEIVRQARVFDIPTVIDGDGLFLITNNLDLVKGNSLAILTPNINEYKRLVEKVLQCELNKKDAYEQLASLAKSIGGVTILQKGKIDLISDGLNVHEVSMLGSPRRCGGQGDILSGSVAVFSSWARHYLCRVADERVASSLNPMVLGSISGSALLRKAASLAFERNKRSTLTTDIIEYLGKSLEDICPAD